MKIESGSLRGRPLKAVAGTRPVIAKVRAAIFNSLGPAVNAAVVADVFAASGALGFEALSRGAAQVVFVDKNPAAIRAITQTARVLGVISHVEAKRTSAEAFVQSAAASSFDLILWDPPYADFSLQLVEAAAALLRPNGILVASCSSKTALPPQLFELTRVRLADYGDTRIGFYRKTAAVHHIIR